MNSQEQPLISVVTPVYNGGKYLSQCIESVLAQTYRNWEYIIVDNCSSDDTLEIAQSFASKNPRIQIHKNQKFVGMAENHNIGLRLISPQSKYCKIVHADDWLFPECLVQMARVAETNPSVGIVGAYGLDGSHVMFTGLPYPSTVVPGHEVCRRTLMGGFYVFGSPTSYLIRSKCIRQREEFYNQNPQHAWFMDHEVCYDVLKDRNYGFVHQILTFTRIHDESNTTVKSRSGFNRDLPAKLNSLTKFGPMYLTKEEYDHRLSQVMGNYYRFLGGNIMRLREKQFRELHRNALMYSGYSLSWFKLAKVFLLRCIRLLLNPKKIIVKTLELSSRYVRRLAPYKISRRIT